MSDTGLWNVRTRTQLIVVLTVVTFVSIVVSDLLSVRRVDRELGEIEGDYVPLLDLGPATQHSFTLIAKRLQESVTSQDVEAQTATRAQKDALIASLDHVPDVVDPGAVARLRSAIEDWYETAFGVSSRIMRGETGESLVSSIEQMQAKQRFVLQLIDSTLMLDRRRLALAFAQARHVERLASWVRMAVPAGLAAAVAILAVGITNRVAGGLAALMRGFERFGRGQFSAAIVLSGNDELTEAARHANRMAGQLDELDKRLRERQSELERANQELEAFSYSVSHDLRAPLRSIDGFSQVLLDDYAGALPTEARDHLSRVRVAAQRMGQLIDDLLRLSRVTRGEMHVGDVNLTQIAKAIGAELARTHPDKATEFVVAEGMTARGDSQLLRIVLENLLDNAWKFAGKVERPRVEVGMTGKEGRRVFFVRDNGAGFDGTYAGRLFQPFQRLHTGAEFPGTGIGLATVRRIVHRHGGEVRAEGVVGQGATFHFTLEPKIGEHA